MDRAAIVARAVVEQMLAALHDEELRCRLKDLLRDEFADVERQAIADRRVDPDA